MGGGVKLWHILTTYILVLVQCMLTSLGTCIHVVVLIHNCACKCSKLVFGPLRVYFNDNVTLAGYLQRLTRVLSLINRTFKLLNVCGVFNFMYKPWFSWIVYLFILTYVVYSDFKTRYSGCIHISRWHRCLSSCAVIYGTYICIIMIVWCVGLQFGDLLCTLLTLR